MSRNGSSVYPTTIDSFARVGTANFEDEVGYEIVHVENEAMDAIEKIEAALGTTGGTSVLKNVLVGQFVATTAGTETFTNKTLTSPIIGGTPVLDATSAIPFYTDGLFRNAIINGNFNVWQRGVSVAFTTTNGYAADCWYVDTATAGDDKTVSRQIAGTGASNYSCRVQRLEGETGHTVLRMSQATEFYNGFEFRGQKVTLSFYLKVGANFSATSNVLTAKILTGKGVDQKATAFTSSAEGATSDITATTSFVKYTLTTTNVIAADITQLGITFSYDPTGTAGANDWFEICQVQLCAGDVALPFSAHNFEDELRRCQRYYYVPNVGNADIYATLGWGQCTTTTNALICVPFPNTMRTTPTLLNSAVATLALQKADSSNQEVTTIGMAGSRGGTDVGMLAVAVAANLVAGDATLLIRDVDAAGYIAFSAEM